VNLQTTKCRATPLDRPNGKQVWRVTHPDAPCIFEAFNPHDIAVMLHRVVLDRQIHLMERES
jgi:hypothetical protein